MRKTAMGILGVGALCLALAGCGGEEEVQTGAPSAETQVTVLQALKKIDKFDSQNKAGTEQERQERQWGEVSAQMKKISGQVPPGRCRTKIDELIAEASKGAATSEKPGSKAWREQAARIGTAYMALSGPCLVVSTSAPSEKRG